MFFRQVTMMSIEAREIERVEFINGTLINGQDIDYLIASNNQIIRPVALPQAAAQQINNDGPETQRPIPDEPYTLGKRSTMPTIIEFQFRNHHPRISDLEESSRNVILKQNARIVEVRNPIRSARFFLLISFKTVIVHAYAELVAMSYLGL